MTHLWHLISDSKDPCEPDLDWYENALKHWICPECRTIRTASPLVDVVLNDRPDNASLNFVSVTGLGVISSAFLREMEESTFRQHFELGTLIGPDGSVIEDHFSFRGKLVFIRGNTNSSFRRCPNCDRFLYHPSGRRYVLRGDVLDDYWYESQLHQLLIPEGKYQTIKSVLRKTWQHKIPVQTQPRDGLDSVP